MENFLDEIPDVELRGDRVILRLLGKQDAEAVFALVDRNREFLSRHLPWPAECVNVEDVEARIDSWEMQALMANGACWGIFEQGAHSLTSADSQSAGVQQSAGGQHLAGVQQPADGLHPANGPQLAGVIVLGWIQAAHRSASVSYWLGEEFTGRGLATSALVLLSRFAFETLGLNRLEISASVQNSASIAVARRAGFAEEGVCREYEYINGHFEDHLRLSLLAKDV
ncbi:MAG: GNAT family N-acetyltransferase [Fibrobacter sp.]|uniref:GNAT family N-acetyltransferase n=1 Tax=Fibrobacter sp. TaxID=35828 RepID=UPI0025BE18EC|nr:GNAT family protein [Fibrobacter sp.]MBR4783799.1 GNAT family N-acetyltransferase [Fibrobacter sp.]